MIYAIEGPDGVGKDSVIEYLVNKHNCKKFFTNFPSYKEELPSYTYEKTRKLMKDYLSGENNCTPYMFQLANLIDKHTHNKYIVECREDKDNIYLLNRWKASGFIYGSLDMAENEGFDIEVSQYLCKQMMDLIEDPTGEICLIANTSTLVERMKKRSEQKSVYEDIEFLENICEMYMQYYRDKEGSYIIYTDNKSIEEVGEEVYNIIKQTQRGGK